MDGRPGLVAAVAVNGGAAISAKEWLAAAVGGGKVRGNDKKAQLNGKDDGSGAGMADRARAFAAEKGF